MGAGGGELGAESMLCRCWLLALHQGCLSMLVALDVLHGTAVVPGWHPTSSWLCWLLWSLMIFPRFPAVSLCTGGLCTLVIFIFGYLFVHPQGLFSLG